MSSWHLQHLCSRITTRVLARRKTMYAFIWISGYLNWRARLACRIARLAIWRSKCWAEITSIWGFLSESIRTCTQAFMCKEKLRRSYTGETVYICSSRTSTAGAIALLANWVWIIISIWARSNTCFVEYYQRSFAFCAPWSIAFCTISKTLLQKQFG